LWKDGSAHKFAHETAAAHYRYRLTQATPQRVRSCKARRRFERALRAVIEAQLALPVSVDDDHGGARAPARSSNARHVASCVCARDLKQQACNSALSVRVRVRVRLLLARYAGTDALASVPLL